MSLENNIDIAEILAECRLNDEPSKSMRAYVDGSISSYNDMPQNPTQDEIVVFREHPIFKKRKRQILINLMGLEGGRPYVSARLSRYAGETEIDWVGGKRPDGSSATGRLQQTHSFPYLGRITGKINQHVFSEAPVRAGADDDVLRDITRTGTSINEVMRNISGITLAAGWCWLGVDAPARKEDGTQFTQAEKEAQKIRPYWQVYSPLDVMDWHFDDLGNLVWIKTKKIVYDDSDPTAIIKPVKVISLWEMGKVTEYTIVEKEDRRYANGRRLNIKKEEIQLTKSNGTPLDVIPFVLCGNLSEKPIAFDDLESINRTIMDLGSVDRANYFNSVYPQLVIPASVMQRAKMDGYAKNIKEVARLLLGFKFPITLDKDDPEPKYLMPDFESIEILGTRIEALKRDLFEVVGLALEQSSRQVASAEAKAWDFMDVAAVMKERAEMLQDIERKAVNVSIAWDDSFQEWEPVYNRDFDIGDFKDEISALVMAGNVSVPDEVTRMIVKKLVERIDRIGSQSTPEEKLKALDSIESWKPTDFIESLAVPEP